jgi:hypothetical protein
MRKRIQPRKRKVNPYVAYLENHGRHATLEDLLEAFPNKTSKQIRDSMSKLVDNYTVDRDIRKDDHQYLISYSLGGYNTKDNTGICWHNPFKLGTT